MFDLIDDCASPYTREDIIKTITTNELKRLNYEYEMCIIDHENNLLDIENKLILENGTDDDAYSLYLAEAEETKAKSKGILTKILDAVRKFFKSVKEFFFGKKDEEIPEKVTLPEDPEKLSKEVDEFCSNAKGFLSGDKKKRKKILAGLGITGGAATILGVIGAKIHKKLKKNMDDLDEVAKKCIADVEAGKIPLEDEGVVKDIANQAKSLGDRVFGCVKSLFSHDKTNIDGDKTYPETPAEFIRECSGINKKLSGYKNKIERVSKNKHRSIFNTLSGENKGIEEFKRLEKIPESDRTDAENNKYRAYLNKYGAKASLRDSENAEYGSLISKISTTIESNTDLMNSLKNVNDKKKIKDATKKIRKQFWEIKSKCDNILETKDKKK